MCCFSCTSLLFAISQALVMANVLLAVWIISENEEVLCEAVCAVIGCNNHSALCSCEIGCGEKCCGDFLEVCHNGNQLTSPLGCKSLESTVTVSTHVATVVILIISPLVIGLSVYAWHHGTKLWARLPRQDEIIQAYQQKAPELRRFAQKIKAGGSVAALQAAEEREAFLLELQKPLVARYGFEESAKGVRDAMVEYADIAENNLVKSSGDFLQITGRRLPVPRKDMLAANTTEELAAACKRGDTLRAEALLGQSGVVNIGFHGLGPAGAKTLAQA
eukprot:g2793.t1